MYPDGEPGSQFLQDLLSAEVRLSLQYLDNSDACSSPAIRPPHPRVRQTFLRSSQTNCPQVRPGPHKTQALLGTHTLDHLSYGAIWVFLPQRLNPGSHNVVFYKAQRMI
jgi:hypothetical protein